MSLEFKKNYLTIEEIGHIIETMKIVNTSYEREMTKVALVSQICIDAKFDEDMGLNEIYNQVAKDGILDNFDSEIHNYYKIDILFKDEISLNKMFKDIIDITKQVDTKDVQGLIKGLTDGDK